MYAGKSANFALKAVAAGLGVAAVAAARPAPLVASGSFVREICALSCNSFLIVCGLLDVNSSSNLSMLRGLLVCFVVCERASTLAHMSGLTSTPSVDHTEHRIETADGHHRFRPGACQASVSAGQAMMRGLGGRLSRNAALV
jgi:hypothetical protein